MIEVAALVLAAGRASRFGAGEGDSKVVADWAGRPLVAHVAATALASKASRVHVVIGHAADKVGAAVADLPVTIVPNLAYASGMASSLKAGIASLPPSCDGVLVLLADMPLVRRGTLDRLIAAFACAPGPCDAVVPIHAGRRGNPILLGRSLFGDLASLEGDVGAREILSKPGIRIETCDVDDDRGLVVDVDTPAALEALRAAAPVQAASADPTSTAGKSRSSLQLRSESRSSMASALKGGEK